VTADGGWTVDGRHRVYLASLPKRTGTKTVVLRVLVESKSYLTIRLASIPPNPPIRPRTWNVARDDLAVMLRTGLAQAITTIRCPSCTGLMSIFDGQRNHKACVFFACSECEECFEI
jgi:hypothetical protein